MTDLISRKAVLELLQGWTDPKAIMPYGAGYNAGVQDAIKAIQNPSGTGGGFGNAAEWEESTGTPEKTAWA